MRRDRLQRHAKLMHLTLEVLEHGMRAFYTSATSASAGTGAGPRSTETSASFAPIFVSHVLNMQCLMPRIIRKSDAGLRLQRVSAECTARAEHTARRVVIAPRLAHDCPRLPAA